MTKTFKISTIILAVILMNINVLNAQGYVWKDYAIKGKVKSVKEYYYFPEKLSNDKKQVLIDSLMYIKTILSFSEDGKVLDERHYTTYGDLENHTFYTLDESTICETERTYDDGILLTEQHIVFHYKYNQIVEVGIKDYEADEEEVLFYGYSDISDKPNSYIVHIVNSLNKNQGYITHIYNKEDNSAEQTVYNVNDDIEDIIIHKYNKDNTLKEQHYVDFEVFEISPGKKMIMASGYKISNFYKYNKQGDLIKEKYIDRTEDVNSLQKYKYDKKYNIIRYYCANNEDGYSILKSKYVFDKQGNWIIRCDYQHGKILNMYTRKYEYY